jgi:outer membrane protein assembly factor BamD (BamD/ComL family)
MDKSEYIKQLKRLIKKYHPDLCADEKLESLYNEISKTLINKLNELKTSQINNEAIKTKEQDYEYYNLGIKYYKNIHPNMFYKNKSKGSFETKSYDELVNVLNNIFMSFNLSEYYFKLLIEKYPNSSWRDDAEDKIKLLNKLNIRYKNMNIAENEITNYDQFVNEMGLNIM